MPPTKNLLLRLDPQLADALRVVAEVEGRPVSEIVREAIRDGVRAAPKPLKLLLLDLSSSPAMDIAGARMLAGLEEELRGAAIAVRLVGARASVRDILRAEGLEEQVGHIDRRLTVEDVVEEFQRGDAARASA